MNRSFRTLMKAEWQVTWWHGLLYGTVFLAPAVIGSILLPVMQQPQVDFTLTLEKLPRALVIVEMIQFTYLFLIGLWSMTAVATFTITEARRQGELAYLLDRPVPRSQVTIAKWLMLTLPAGTMAWLSIPITLTVLYGVMIWLLPEADTTNTVDAYLSALRSAVSSLPWVISLAAFSVANALFWSVRVDRTGLAFVAAFTTLIIGLFITDNQMSLGIIGFWLPIKTPQITEVDIFEVQPLRTATVLLMTGVLLYAGKWTLVKREW